MNWCFEELYIFSIVRVQVVKFGLSEKHTKFEKNLPHGLDVYYVNVQSMRKIAQIFECFSESPNFNW